MKSKTEYRAYKRVKQREWHRRNPLRSRAHGAKVRARNLGVDYNIDADYVESLWTGKCAVLGTEMKPEEATLDRIHNHLGYIKGNVAWISWRMNKIKCDATLEELEAIVKYMKESE